MKVERLPSAGITQLEALSMMGEVLTDSSRCPSSKFIETYQ